MRTGVAARVLGWMAVALVLSGCGAYLRTVRGYDGPVRDEGRIARLIVPAPAYLQTLDGAPVRAQGSRFTVVELAPGAHQATVIYRTVTGGYGYTLTRSTSPSSFEFAAEAGSFYMIGSLVDGEVVHQYLAGPFPAALEIPGSGRRVSIARKPGAAADAAAENLCIAVDGPEGTRIYDAFLVAGQGPSYSANKQHVAFFLYHGRADLQWVVDGVAEGARYERLLGDVVFSPDGTRHAYVGVRGGARELRVDDRAVDVGGLQVDGGAFAFSPDGKRFAYLGKDAAGSRFVVIDGKALGPFQDSFDPSFSEKRGALMFFAQEGGLWRLYTDRARGAVTSVGKPPPFIVTNPSGERVAWVAHSRGSYSVVIDDVAGPAFDGVSLPEFSPKSEHLVYLAEEGEHLMHVVVDGAVVATHPKIDMRSLGFGEEGDKLFFKVYGDGNWVMKELPLPRRPGSAAPAPDATPDAAPAPAPAAEPPPTAAPDLPQSAT